MTLYEKIGAENIRAAITEFYVRAFADVIIGHFFFNHDRQAITAKQIDFATAMLGGPRNYRGQPLEKIHAPLPIRTAHFRRRQVLMAEVLREHGIADADAHAWLSMEDSLKPLIMSAGTPHCGPVPARPRSD